MEKRSQRRSSFSRLVVHVGGPATVLGGVIWLLAWVHFLLTHGPTSSDYENTFLGLSYYDSTKLTVFAIGLCIVGLVSLRTRRPVGVRGRVGTWGHFLAVTALIVMTVGMAASVWTIPWGLANGWEKAGLISGKDNRRRGGAKSHSRDLGLSEAPRSWTKV